MGWYVFVPILFPLRSPRFEAFLPYGLLFPPTNGDRSTGVGALKATEMTAGVQPYPRCSRVPPPGANTQYTMHSFRVGGAVSRALPGTAVAEIMSLVGWNASGRHEQAYMGANALSYLHYQSWPNGTQRSHEWTPKVR